MDTIIREILTAAIHAPSGENVQPWRFHVTENRIELHHADVDSEIYDTGNRGSYVSHGAAIENMVIAANNRGYEIEITLFPNHGHKGHVATLILNKSVNPSADEIAPNLAEAIEERVTNRNQYETKNLADSASAAISDAAAVYPQVELLRFTDRSKILSLAKVGSTNEEVMLQNRQLHDFFFDHVTWTKEEDDQKKVGFYIKTLGLPAPVQGLFRLFRHWAVMNVLRKTGFPALVGKGNSQTYAASAEICMLRIKEDSPSNFVYAGRTLERIWLTATKHGISLQPLAGTLFMNYYIQAHGSNSVFSSREIRLIKEANKAAYAIMEAPGTIAFMFRLGYGERPEAHASRFPLEHFLI